MSLRRTSRTTTGLAALLIAVGTGGTGVAAAGEPDGSRDDDLRVTARSFTEVDGGAAVRLPVYTAVVDGRAVHYVVTEASTRREARRLGVNYSPRLANAVGTAAVVDGAYDAAGRLQVAATVDFAPERVVVPGSPHPFPPATAQPGAVGEEGYTPLVRLPDGTVLNAPHIANDTGQADKLRSLDLGAGTAVLEMTDGFYEGDLVRYISTEATTPLSAALENATYAPALAAAPGEAPGADDGNGPETGSLEEIGVVVNGATGSGDPDRQGLTSALTDGLSPLNVVAEEPENSRNSHYTPLWEGHLVEWPDGTRPSLLDDFDDIEDLAEDGEVTGIGGSAFGPSGFIVNCPIIST